jgi:hypothetical protein
MTELRILLATVFLLLLSVFTLSSAVSASDDDRGEIHSTGSYEHEGHTRGVRTRHARAKTILPRVTHTGSVQAKTPTPVAPKTPTTPVTPVAAAVSKSSTVSYRTPDGSASVTFSATVKGGVITAATSTTRAGGTSGYYQDAFAQQLAGAVIGKKIAGLNLSAIGGASLTTASFEQFVVSNF